MPQRLHAKNKARSRAESTPSSVASSLFNKGAWEHARTLSEPCYFEDGVEHDRNVILAHGTKRSYVYTTDMIQHGLPEFVFLDVPDCPEAHQICGQWIVNQLAWQLRQALNEATDEASRQAIIKESNKNTFTVNKVIVPKKKHSIHVDGSSSSSPNDRIGSAKKTRAAVATAIAANNDVREVSLKFRLRVAAPATKLYQMMCTNFLNNRFCPAGVVVVMPCMEPDSPAHEYWGNLDGCLPPHTKPKDQLEDVFNQGLDAYIYKVAKSHGTYRGKIPYGLFEPVEVFYSTASQKKEITTTTKTTKTSGHSTGTKKTKKIKTATKKTTAAKKKKPAICEVKKEGFSPIKTKTKKKVDELVTDIVEKKLILGEKTSKRT
jgi:hypothetical protein